MESGSSGQHSHMRVLATVEIPIRFESESTLPKSSGVMCVLEPIGADQDDKKAIPVFHLQMNGEERSRLMITASDAEVAVFSEQLKGLPYLLMFVERKVYYATFPGRGKEKTERGFTVKVHCSYPEKVVADLASSAIAYAVGWMFGLGDSDLRGWVNANRGNPTDCTDGELISYFQDRGSDFGCVNSLEYTYYCEDKEDVVANFRGQLNKPIWSVSGDKVMVLHGSKHWRTYIYTHSDLKCRGWLEVRGESVNETDTFPRQFTIAPDGDDDFFFSGSNSCVKWGFKSLKKGGVTRRDPKDWAGDAHVDDYIVRLIPGEHEVYIWHDQKCKCMKEDTSSSSGTEGEEPPALAEVGDGKDVVLSEPIGPGGRKRSASDMCE